MPIPELDNVRQKYPQYSDMDDVTLATKLASKYPQYSDLISKTVPDVSSKLTFGDIGAGAIGTGAAVYAGAKAGRLIPKATGDVARRVAGINTKSIKWLKQRGPMNIFNPLKEQADYLGTYLTNEVDEIVKGQVQSLDEYFTQVINSVSNTAKISLSKTRNIIAKELSGTGLIAKNGKPTKLLTNPAVSNTVYRKLYDVFDLLKKYPSITKKQVELVRDSLNTMFKGTPGDIIVAQAKEALYDDLENSGVTNMGRAVKGYKIARELEKYPAKKIYTVLTRIANPKTADLAIKELREIVPQFADDIAKNIKDHVVAMQFSRTPEGMASKSVYPSVAGFFRDITRAGLKGYYENIYPLVQKGKSLIPKMPKPTTIINAGKPLLKGAKTVTKLIGKASLPGILVSEMAFPSEMGAGELTPEEQGMFAAERHAKGVYEKGYPELRKRIILH